MTSSDSTTLSAVERKALRTEQAAAQRAQQLRISKSRAQAEGRAQVVPTAEGWKQEMGADGRPELQFATKRRVSQPPTPVTEKRFI